MRYTDDGYISTEVELPKEGSRVACKFSGYRDGLPGIATYDGENFVFDSPYQSFKDQDEHLKHGSLGSYSGYWRYLDTPAQEKLDTGHPGAPDGHSDVYSNPLIEELETSIELAAKLLDSYADEIAVKGSHIQNLERIISEQRKALDSKEKEVKGLKDRLADSDKLSQEGWINPKDRIPGNDGKTEYDVRLPNGDEMVGCWISKIAKGMWSVPSSSLEGHREFISTIGTYWRPTWTESTSENLAKLAPRETLEVKTENGTYRGFLSTGTKDEWHLGSPSCHFMDGGTANDGKEYCVLRSVKGTWFRKLPRK